MTWNWLPVGLMALVCLTGCDDKTKAVTRGRLKDAWAQISDKDYVRTRGIGVPPLKAQGVTHRRGLSRGAALTMARFEMLALIKGVTIHGGLTVGDLMQSNSKITEVANRIIRGAEEIQSEWTADDGAVVTLELRRSMIEKLILEDQRWEPPTEREQFEQENLRLEAKAKGGVNYVWNDSFEGGRTPGKALGLGLLVPGLGQVYADGGTTGSIGYYTFALVGGLAGAGVHFMEPHEVGGARADGTREKLRSPEIGTALLVAAGALHVWGAVDGMNSVHKKGGYFRVEPTGSGAKISFVNRF